MVEIKRRTPGQSYIRKPIGVNKVNNESANAYAAEARMFDQIASTGFAVAAGLQRRANIKDEKAGIAFAETAVTIDEQGNASVKPIPDGLGAYGQTAAQEEVVRRYSIASENQLKSAHKLISAQANGDGERYKTLWSQYVADKSDLIAKSDASPYLNDFTNIANSYGASGFVDIELNKYKQDQEKAEIEFRTNVLGASADIVNLNANQKFDAASDLYNKKIAEVKASTYLTPAAKAQYIRSLQKSNVEGLVAGATSNATVAELLELGNNATDLKWSDATLQKFPQLAKVSKEMDVELWSAVGSNIRLARTETDQLNKTNSVANFVQDNYREGRTDGSSAVIRKGVDANLGYLSEEDALAPSFQQATIENNAAHPGQHLQTIAERAVDSGLYNVSDIVPLMSRLANIDAAQVVSGRTISQYFGGGTKGKNIEALYTYLSGVGRAGNDAVIDAYTRRATVDRETLIQTMITNSEYEVQVGETPSATQIARHYLDNSSIFDEVPLALREDMLAQTKYLLGFPDAGNVADALYAVGVENYTPSIFYETSRVNSSYSMYGYSPELYLSPQSSKNLKADLDSYAQDGENLFLKPILSSGISAKYIAYSLDIKGGQVYKLGGSGNPIVFDTQNYRTASKVIENSRVVELDLMRAQAIGERAQSKRSAMNLMKFQILD